MDPELALVIGLVVGGFSVPAVVSAFSDGRAPRAAAVALMVGGGLVIWAFSQKSGGYALEDIPKAFISVAGRYLN